MSEVYDIVIIGGGPAGLTAGLYAARARLNVVLLERMGFGGQLLTYERVENYPGFPEGVSAFGLSELFRAQALRFGLLTRNAEVTGLDLGNSTRQVVLTDGSIEARTVILASGASPNKLNVKGETEFTGKGVSYCAVCDAPFYRDQEVAVVGGGDTAVEEAVYLTKFASRVYVIHRRDRLRATGIIQEKAFQNEKITFILDSVVKEIQGGSQGVERLILEGTLDHQVTELAVSGLFVLVGIHPNTDYVPPELERDPLGFLRTDLEMATTVPGVFAAGDVRSKELRQIATAVGDGATAAFGADRYIQAHSF